MENENIGVLDFETDPFLCGRVPLPFAVCVYFRPDDYVLLWDDRRGDFIDRAVRLIRSLPPCTLYAHNGGKFDFHYLIEDVEHGTITIRNGRIVKMKIGKVTLKDSFPLMPFALEEFRKTPIDYSLFEYSQRNKPANRKRIESYLFDDCRDLHELLTGFRAIMGDRDTIGSAAFYQIRKLGIEIKSLNETHDDMFRPFYYGGRNQAFQRGIFRGSFQYLDINSQYPFSMLQKHAHGSEYSHSRKLPSMERIGHCFIRCIAHSRGALPLREDDGALSFPHTTAEFFTTGWEIRAAIETRAIEIKKVIDVWRPQSFISFGPFVRSFFQKRLDAKARGDKIAALAYKYGMNSPYGKCAQNPREFREYILAPFGKYVPGFEWENDFGNVSIWSRPSYHGFGFFDVATAASITGFARSILWRAICQSKNVLYTDTDSLICESSKVKIGAELGLFKNEHAPDVRVTEARIAGKKLYGVKWSRPDDRGNSYKIASKGARLSWHDLLLLCKGKTIIWENEAPTFAIGGTHFIKRRIHAT